MSQLGALRNVIALLRQPEDGPRVVGWLEHLQKNSRRAERWPQGAIAAVTNLVDDHEAIWSTLASAEWPRMTKDTKSPLKRELWALAVRTLFDACIRAHKRELDQARGDQAQEVVHGA
jgi:CRISPR-associated protein Csx10